MYNKHFSLGEGPFSLAPDPHYLYMSEGHREAFAHLLYGVRDQGGFVLLTGEVGTGKTTVCRCLLEQMPPEVNTALILNPKVTALELLASICDELAISYPSGTTSVKVLVDQINSYLLAAHAQGRKTVLIIDEAQNLEPDVLEQVRLLTNLETNRQKLLQIIMLGQPELLAKLERQELRQLAQRITARYHLGPLQRAEIGPYISHRLAVGGLNSQPFSPALISKLYKLSGGVPRLINILCDRAMLGAYAQGEKAVSLPILARAAKEVLGRGRPGWWSNKALPRPALLFAALLIAAGAGGATYYRYVVHQKSALGPVSQQETAAHPTLGQPAIGAEGPSVPVPTDGSQSFKQPALVQGQPVAVQPDTAAASAPADNPVEWPRNESIGTSLPRSFAALFARWGVDRTPNSEEEGCRYAETFGLRCLQLQGELEGLLRLDLPAVLRFYDQKGGRYYGTLVAASDQSATLVLGRTTREVALKDLVSNWYGNSTILWRPPPGYPKIILPDFHGPAIVWLDQQLAAINHRPAQSPASGLYDPRLFKEVLEFQRGRRLAPDGILGPQTLIFIGKAAGLDMPTLRAGQEAR